MLQRTLATTLFLALAAAGLPVLAAPLSPDPVPAAAAVPATPTQAEVMRIPDELRALVHARVVAPGPGPTARLERLVELIFGERGMALEYDYQTTRTVAETWRDRRANCLSFSLLFVALAREAGLDADVQEVGEVLAWYEDQGIVYNADHVNVGVRVGSQTKIVDLDRNVLVSRERPHIVSDTRAMAHYHNNRGAELLAAGDEAAALAALRASLADDAGFVAAWNNLGVLLQRQEDLRGAEQAFLTALDLRPFYGAALSNLVALYRRSGQDGKARSYARRQERVQRNDPFHQFMLAVRCENGGDYACAIRHYRTAIRIQDGQHQFHFGLARAYFLAGDLQRARRELVRAHELGTTSQVRQVYLRKLEHLRHWREATAAHAAPRG
ncbi:transglutaminase [Pseudoxanthomonas jiangsuensis]|uniref:tetratricopeptide repeat protein n=1 Tax=Pseudoxanthomonas jiangsuensis TaxID=619688 RepID=UPI001391B90B|nr:tetratricopeptide repeat protein [Pseudoxanthomonas jiangsuensis]KAF1692539.1 transglutaminase [Pseudoxanthomonas jiangsuensis]